MLTNFQLDSKEQSSVKYQSYIIFFFQENATENVISKMLPNMPRA